MDQEHAGAPALATFTEAQRQQAMARFAVLRSHLHEGIPLLTSCKNFEICRIGSVAAIIYGFKLCFSAFLLSGGQASEYPHLASCSSRAQLRSQF